MHTLPQVGDWIALDQEQLDSLGVDFPDENQIVAQLLAIRGGVWILSNNAGTPIEVPAGSLELAY